MLKCRLQTWVIWVCAIPVCQQISNLTYRNHLDPLVYFMGQNVFQYSPEKAQNLNTAQGSMVKPCLSPVTKPWVSIHRRYVS